MTQTTGKGYQLNIATVSDVHLGHSRVPATHILSRLRKAFPFSETTAKLDLLIIAGDLFDRMLNLPDDDVIQIQTWMAELLSLCKKYDIVLRILEGTPSHDRKQSKQFEVINTVSGIHADCRYVDTLSIEENEKLGISILYIPDEWRHDPEDTWADVLSVLRKHNLKQVDYAVMHGVFEFQLPPHVPIPCHDSERYLKLVRKYITIGHHHVMRTKDRILAQGSFDRIAHGEEHPKGYFWIEVNDPVSCERDRITFKENKEATRFVTYNLTQVSLEAAEGILSDVKTLPAHSHIRVLLSPETDLRGLVKAYMENYPQHHWKTKLHEADNQQILTPKQIKNTFQAVEITAQTLPNMIEARLKQNGLSEDDIQSCMTLLKHQMTAD
jgi:predicted MPP superfamily phosphohydrolase